jgi:hypothetical protein
VEPPGPAGPPLTPGEADALWEYAARTAADATARIRSCTAAGNPAAAADAASAASDTLHTAAAALGRRTLRQAAADYDRAARQPWGRIPARTPAGNQLRHAARLISAYVYLTGDRMLTPVVLLVRLAALAEAVAKLRESQQRAAQAAAALRAARHLRTATMTSTKAYSCSAARSGAAPGEIRFRTYRDLHDPAVAIPEEVTAAHRAGTAGTNKIPASCRVSYAACRAAASNPVRVITRFSNPGCEKWFRCVAMPPLPTLQLDTRCRRRRLKHSRRSSAGHLRRAHIGAEMLTMAAPGDSRLPRLASRTVAANPRYGARYPPICVVIAVWRCRWMSRPKD